MCSAKTGASTTLRAACVTRKSRGRARINKEEEKAVFVDVGGIFLATTGTGRKCLADAEWSRERATTYNKRVTNMQQIRTQAQQTHTHPV